MRKSLSRTHGLYILSKEQQANRSTELQARQHALSTRAAEQMDERRKHPLTPRQLETLAQLAQERGYANPQQVMSRIEFIIKNNIDYLDYRHRAYRDNSYDTKVQEDNEVLALAHEMLSQAYGTLEEV